MTGADITAAYFSPFHVILYLTLVMGVMIFFLQWQWSRRCRNEVKVLVVKSDGSTATVYAPKDSGHVTITNPATDTTRVWPISKISAIETLYPGDGFIPMFLQKQIKTVIVDEVDMEPLLNRGSTGTLVASPDVVKAIRQILAQRSTSEEADEESNDWVNSLTTAPTRELVGDPAALGGLMRSGVLKALATVSDELLEEFRNLRSQLQRFAGLNSTIIYAALGLIILLVGFLIYQTMQGVAPDTDITTQLGQIKDALGIE